MNAVAMGSVYLDKGEGLEYLEAQVERMSKQRPEQYFIDFICLPGQIDEARRLVERFYVLVADILPLEQVFVGITCNDMIRPAAMALVMISKASGLDIKDINPDRKGR